MYVSQNMINEMADRYGDPKRAEFSFPVSGHEYAFIRSTQKYQREHDATVYIIKDGEVVVIAKHHYPPGMYRAPSGGLHPGESFEEGIAREVLEETGTEITLERFLLVSNVTFTNSSGEIPWRSFVFQARYAKGEFQFTDTREIREVRLARLSEFDTFGRIMRSLDVGGLHYRAALHEAVAPLLVV